MIIKILKNLLKLLPIIIIALTSWVLYLFWENYEPKNIVLSNSIEAKDVIVSSKVGGRILNIYIKEGDNVSRGQKLLELESDEIVAQLHQVKASLKKANFEYQDLVKGARPQEIFQAKENVLEVQAKLEKAKLNYENSLDDFVRMENLYKKGAISKQKYNGYKTSKDIALKEVDSFQHKLIKEKEYESLVQEGARKDQISALREEINYFEFKVKELEKYVNELSIISPLNGEISSFDLKVGELVKPNEPLLTIVDLSDIYVRVYVPANKLAKVKIKEKVKLKADSFPNDIFQGYISYIGAQAEYTPRNVQTPEERTKLVYPVKVQIVNKENKLRDGMYITVEL